MSVQLDEIFGRSDAVVSREVVGEVLLVPVAAGLNAPGRLYATNPVGGVVWGLCDGVRSVREIVGGVLATFDVSEDEATQDVCFFLDTLLDAGLIQRITKDVNELGAP